MTPRFDLVGLVVADMAGSLAFYRRLGLDIPAEADDAPHAEAALPGGLRLAWDTTDTVRSFDPEWTPPTGGHRVALAFVCDSPEAVNVTYADLVAAGYDGHLEPWDAFWGQRYAVVHDPDGNAVELFAPLPASGKRGTAMEHVVVDGLRLAYRHAGTGRPLVLLHGAVCDSRVWRVEMEQLADEYTVVAWDAPGCGESSDPAPGFRMPDYAACLAYLIDALELDHPHVLGHSYGSSLALELYRQRPQLPASLLLVGAYAGWTGSLPADEVERRLQFALRSADLPSGGFDPTSMPGLFSDAMPDDRAAELVAIMSEIRAAGTRSMALALAESDLREMLGAIEVPTLLLYGDADERAPATVAAALHAAIPTSTLVFMAGLGHECFLESSDLFMAEVRNFLATVDA